MWPTFSQNPALIPACKAGVDKGCKADTPQRIIMLSEDFVKWPVALKACCLALGAAGCNDGPVR